MAQLGKLTLVLAGGFWLAAASLRANTITEDFSADPQQGGWGIFGDTNLFHWNSTNQNLEVTWDSSQPNSYFYHPLGTVLARDDDFSLAFDLRLADIASGTEPGKTGGLEIALGFLNLAKATSPNFMRGAYGGASSLVEFDYFPAGYYDFGGSVYEVAPTTTPTFLSTNSYDFAPTVYVPYEIELPTNVLVHVLMTYSASNQTMTAQLWTNGAPFVQLPAVVLTDTNTSGFSEGDDYRVDTFAISSYSSAGDDYDSVLAHGSVDNVVLTVPEPIRDFSGTFTNGLWQSSFLSRSNWLYALQRSEDFRSWIDVSSAVAGNGTNLFLDDPAPAPAKGFYRVRAERP